MCLHVHEMINPVRQHAKVEEFALILVRSMVRWPSGWAQPPFRDLVAEATVGPLVITE